MSIAEKALLLKQDFDEVYEAGKEKEWSDFWDVFQGSNNYSYLHAFSRNKFTDENYNPKYPIVTNSFNSAFSANTKITDTKVDIELIGQVDSLANAFLNCTSLKTIRKIKISASSVIFTTDTTFKYCYVLENITFEGELRGNLYFQWSDKLTHDSLMSIINCLADYSEDTSGETHTLQLGAENLAKLTNAEQEIARTKGWTLK